VTGVRHQGHCHGNCSEDPLLESCFFKERTFI
jgi:hypothetical protein